MLSINGNYSPWKWLLNCQHQQDRSICIDMIDIDDKTIDNHTWKVSFRMLITLTLKLGAYVLISRFSFTFSVSSIALFSCSSFSISSSSSWCDTYFFDFVSSCFLSLTSSIFLSSIFYLERESSPHSLSFYYLSWRISIWSSWFLICFSDTSFATDVWRVFDLWRFWVSSELLDSSEVKCWDFLNNFA